MARKPTSQVVTTTRTRATGWRIRVALIILLVIAVATILTTNRLLTDRFTETTRNRAELRLALYSGNLLSELRRNSSVPQLLARDPALIGALNSADYSQSTQRLLSFVEEIGAASLMLLDRDGRTVAATDRARLGENHRSGAYFLDALRSNNTIFTVTPREAGGYVFTYTRRVDWQAETLGVIVVEVNLQNFERFSMGYRMVKELGIRGQTERFLRQAIVLFVHHSPSAGVLRRVFTRSALC